MINDDIRYTDFEININYQLNNGMSELWINPDNFHELKQFNEKQQCKIKSIFLYGMYFSVTALLFL